VLLACFGAGCSLFFDPDNHLTPLDGGGDTSADAPPPDAPPSDAPPSDAPPPDAPPLDGGATRSFCFAAEEPDPWNTVIGDATMELSLLLSVAITGTDPPEANLAHVLNGGALIRRVDLDDIEVSPGEDFDLSDGIEGGGHPGQAPNSFAIRRGRTIDELAIALVGEPEDPTTTGSGLYVAVYDPDGPIPLLDGSTLYSGSPPAARGLEPAVITGSPTTRGRHIFRELRRVTAADTPMWGSMLVGSITENGVLTGPSVPTEERGVWAAASGGHVAMLSTPEPGQMQLWTGVGNPRNLDFTLPSSRPFESDIAWLDGGRYVITYTAGGENLSHHAIECTVECTGDDCQIVADCPISPAVDAGRDGLGPAFVATDEVEGLGVAVVLLEDAGDFWALSLSFIGPDLSPILDSTGARLNVGLGGFLDPFAIDVDTLVRGERITVLIAIGYEGADATNITMLTWEGALCP
jgi:hypothetical protein